MGTDAALGLRTSTGIRRAGPLTSPGISALAWTFSTRVTFTTRLGAGFTAVRRGARSGFPVDNTGDADAEPGACDFCGFFDFDDAEGLEAVADEELLPG